MTHDSIADMIRPLGAFEQIIDLYTHRNPVQFSLIIELTDGIDQNTLIEGLATLQGIHPLLAARIDRSGSEVGGPVFHRTETAIPLRIVHGTSWQQIAAEEQTDPMDPTRGPLVRVVQIDDQPGTVGSTLVLTFGHQITDGRGALRAVQDLLSIVNGERLADSDPPATQESLLADLPIDASPGAAEPAAGATPTELPAETETPAEAEKPLPAGRLRPFDRSLPALQSDNLNSTSLRRLRQRSRDEGCTVQAALCAAAASELLESSGLETSGRRQVRINVPIDLRGAAGLADEVVVRFGAAMIVLDGTPDFWELARSATAQLTAARAVGTVRDAGLMLAANAPTSSDGAEAAMLAATTADIEITNLGVADSPATAEGVRAIWGPTMTTQVAGEQVLGVITQGEVLRMVNLTHDPIDGLVDGLRRRLAAACG